MNVDELKKINEMSKNLQQSGLAENSNSGKEMAKDIVGGDLPEEEKNNKKDEYIKREEFERMLERYNRSVAQEFEKLREEMKSLKNSMENSKPEPANNSEVKSEKQENLKEESKGEEKKSGEDKTEKPKNGNDPNDFSDSEVSVENIFYCGSNK